MSGWTEADIPDQAGRTALVTGGNSGLGLATAKALAAKGARVLIGCRDAQRGAGALEAIAAVAAGAPPALILLDLADLASVRAAADAIGQAAPSLDVLVNNAGVMATPYATTADGFELQLGTNHLGHFALTGLLLPLLLAAPAPRVVTTSSQAHRAGAIRFDDLQSTRSYRRWAAYGQSKLANLLFAAELARRARGTALISVAAHPGYASTELARGGGNPLLVGVVTLGFRLFAQSAENGALPQLMAATAPGVAGGDYFGPGGPFEGWGSPRPVGRSAAANDAGVAHRLWERSEELTGVTYDWPPAETPG